MRMWAVAIRILRQFMRDKRTLAMMFLAPILVLFLLHTIFGAPEYKPNLIAVDLNDTFVQALRDTGANVDIKSEAEGRVEIKKVIADGMVLIEKDNQLRIVLEGSDPTKTSAVIQDVQKAYASVQSAPKTGIIKLSNGMSLDISKIPQLQPPTKKEPILEYVHGKKDMKTFDYFGPVFIGFFIFFFTFMTSGISFLRERTGGTLERIMATPLRRWEIVMGYVLGFGLFVLIQSTIVAWAGIYWIKLPLLGSFYHVLLISLTLALVSMTLGILISSFANTELQVIQIMQIIVIPQIFFSGIFDMTNMPLWMKKLSEAMPLTYGAHALRSVMLRGMGWSDIAPDIYVLLGFVLVFIILNILALKKYRKI